MFGIKSITFYDRFSLKNIFSSFLLLLSLLLILFSVTSTDVVNAQVAGGTHSCVGTNLVDLTIRQTYSSTISVVLTAGCKVTIRGITTPGISFVGTISVDTDITVDQVTFLDPDNDPTVNSVAFLYALVLLDTAKQGMGVLQLTNCKGTRYMELVKASAISLFAFTPTLIAKTVIIRDNYLACPGMKAGFVCGVASFIAGASIANELTITGNKLQGASDDQHDEATPVYVIASIRGNSFISQAPVINITGNSFDVSFNAGGCVMTVMSFAVSAISAPNSELIFNSNKIDPFYPNVPTSGTVSVGMLAFLNSAMTGFQKVTINTNYCLMNFQTGGTQGTVDAALLIVKSTTDGIQDIADFSMTNNKWYVLGTASVTQSSMIVTPSVTNTKLTITNNAAMCMQSVVSLSVIPYNLGVLGGATTSLSFTGNTFQLADGALCTATTVIESTFLQITGFSSAISSLALNSNTFTIGLPPSFLVAKYTFFTFPFYSFRIQQTELISNYVPFTANTQPTILPQLFMIDSPQILEEKEMGAAYARLGYNANDVTAALNNDQTYFMPMNAATRQVTGDGAYKDAWIFHRKEFTDVWVGAFGEADATIDGATAASVLSAKQALMATMIMCSGLSSSMLLLKDSYDRTKYPSIPTYTTSSQSNSIRFLGSSTFCELGVGKSVKVTTTASSTTTSETTTSTTTTSTTTTSTTTEPPTPAPPTTTSNTSTTTTTPAPPTTTTTTTTTVVTNATSATTTTTTTTPAPSPAPLTQSAGATLAVASATMAAVPVVAMGVSRMQSISSLLGAGADCTGPEPGKELGFVDNPLGISVPDAGDDGKYLVGSIVGNVYGLGGILLVQVGLGYLWCRLIDRKWPGFVEVTGRCHVTVFLLLFIGLYMTPTITNALTYAIRTDSGKPGWATFAVLSMLISQGACLYWVIYSVYLRTKVEKFITAEEEERKRRKLGGGHHLIGSDAHDGDDEDEDDEFDDDDESSSSSDDEDRESEIGNKNNNNNNNDEHDHDLDHLLAASTTSSATLSRKSSKREKKRERDNRIHRENSQLLESLLVAANDEDNKNKKNNSKNKKGDSSAKKEQQEPFIHAGENEMKKLDSFLIPASRETSGLGEGGEAPSSPTNIFISGSESTTPTATTSPNFLFSNNNSDLTTITMPARSFHMTEEDKKQRREEKELRRAQRQARKNILERQRQDAEAEKNILETQKEKERQDAIAKYGPFFALFSFQCVIGTSKDLVVRFYRYWIQPKGDWYVPRNADDEEYHGFESAAPIVDAFMSGGRFFTTADLLLQIGLGLAPVIAELVGDGRKSCLALGLVLTINLTIYLILLLFYFPMRSRLMQLVLFVVTAIQVIVCIIACITYDSSPDWLENAQDVLFIAQTFQSVCGMVDWANRFVTPFLIRLYYKRFVKKRYALRFDDFMVNLKAQEADDLAAQKIQDEETQKILKSYRTTENEEQMRKLKEEADKKKLLEEEQERARLLKLKMEKDALEQEELRKRLEAEATKKRKKIPRKIRQEESVSVPPAGPTDEEIMAWRRHELKQLSLAMHDLL